MKNFSILSLVFVFISGTSLLGQSDTLITTNGETISGELKKMDQGVLTFKTDYSDSDFEIKWDNILTIRSNNIFIFSLSDGVRLVGTINGNRDSFSIETHDALYLKRTDNIVTIEPLDDSFLKRLSASIGIGFNLNKVNNLRQFNMRSGLGYFSQSWKADASFDAVYSEQDSIDQTKRIDANISYNYFLGNDWYISASSNFLQNDEQKLALRSTPKLGFGNYIIHTNKTYLSMDMGLSGNFEEYTDPTSEKRNSSEIFISAELNMFDFGDLNLLTNTIFYKNLNESDRIRSDSKIDLKYDVLGTDFYIKLGYTLNYDSQPVEGAASTDYVIQTTFGWDL